MEKEDVEVVVVVAMTTPMVGIHGSDTVASPRVAQRPGGGCELLRGDEA